MLGQVHVVPLPLQTLPAEILSLWGVRLCLKCNLQSCCDVWKGWCFAAQGHASMPTKLASNILCTG